MHQVGAVVVVSAALDRTHVHIRIVGVFDEQVGRDRLLYLDAALRRLRTILDDGGGGELVRHLSILLYRKEVIIFVEELADGWCPLLSLNGSVGGDTVH